jgi:hypothetical protein
MSATRTNSDGLLEIWHAETGAYVSANVLLQVEGGLLSALVPNQVALLSDIRDASTYLHTIEEELLDIRQSVFAFNDKLAQTNVLLTTLAQIDTALSIVKGAIDSLENLGATTNNLLAAVQSETAQLSGKIPTTLGAKLRTQSLSVAMATDSEIFTSLSNIFATLTSGGSNSVVNLLALLSGKIPTTLGAKLRSESLSVALATDSTLFASLTNILNALSDSGINSTGGTNSALSYLSTIATAQFWRTPLKINTNSPIISAATAAVGSTVYTLNSQTTGLCLQNFFSATGLSAQFVIDLRLTSGATALTDRTLYYRGDVATPFAASTGAFSGESPIIVPTHGNAQVIVHLSAISGGGNVTTFAKEIR